ncbi:Chlorovirus glycoprotein repeat domain-containing protein [Acanthocystis turfacea Chlorella virus MN0810.1]|nr:Chlorovirus glycoprotein repeat domain-containing protein [Acanthocystis turfacea Chlorella virus MN0810.1]
MSALYLSTGTVANNMIFLSNVGNAADNNVHSIGLIGTGFATQMRFATKAGSLGYIFTQSVPALADQVEIANLDYFSGATFRNSGVGAFSAQVINTSLAYSGSMLATESSTAAAGSYNHIRCRDPAGNVFRVLGNGTVFNVNGTITTGADYAEMFEWEDGNSGNEDRRGNPVVLSGNKIRVANAHTNPLDIVGVVSTNPTVVGDTAWNDWNGRYLKDKYGQTINRTRYYLANTDNENEIIPCSQGDTPPTGYIVKTLQEYTPNPMYNPNVAYTSRLERPEWAPVGLVGKVRVDNTFVTANIVHPSWKPLQVFDDPADPGNASAQVVEMLIGVTPPANDTKELQAQISTLQATVEMLKQALNL